MFLTFFLKFDSRLSAVARNLQMRTVQGSNSTSHGCTVNLSATSPGYGDIEPNRQKAIFCGNRPVWRQRRAGLFSCKPKSVGREDSYVERIRGVSLYCSGPDGARYEGKATVRARWEEVFQTYPDLLYESEDMFAIGDRCTLRWVAQRTGKDGNRERYRGVDIFRVRDGKIAEKLVYTKR